LKKKKSLFLFLVLLTVVIFPAAAQFNDTMDTILAGDQLTYGAASFLVLNGAGLISDDMSTAEAAGEMSRVLPDLVKSPNDNVTLSEYAWMIMTVYDIPGGLLYTIFPGPRYALRELRFQEIIQDVAYPKMDVPGQRAVHILGRAVRWKEEAQNENM